MRAYSDRKFSFTDADRLELARLLVKAGYTARIGRERTQNGKAFRHFVEFTREGEINDVE